MGTVPQSHEKRMRQTNRPHVAQSVCDRRTVPKPHPFFLQNMTFSVISDGSPVTL
ncbi:MAG: hypothetical protein JG777_1068 [Clostridia bacterium]|jgi:hypothetical protein|nr:hypothetical protein [Clostridia bacterium]